VFIALEARCNLVSISSGKLGKLRSRTSELAFALFHIASAEHCSKAGGRNKIKSTLYVCDGSIYANDLLSSRRLLLPLRVSTPYGVGRVYSERRNDIRLTATRAVCLHTLSRTVGCLLAAY
jgi:hypothetical protein